MGRLGPYISSARDTDFFGRPIHLQPPIRVRGRQELIPFPHAERVGGHRAQMQFHSIVDVRFLITLCGEHFVLVELRRDRSGDKAIQPKKSNVVVARSAEPVVDASRKPPPKFRILSNGNFAASFGGCPSEDWPHASASYTRASSARSSGYRRKSRSLPYPEEPPTGPREARPMIDSAASRGIGRRTSHGSRRRYAPPHHEAFLILKSPR
jgi:hypothetical protein